MDEKELNNRILQKLSEFESMDVIQPSAGWNKSLMKKLDSAKPYSQSNISVSKFTIAVLIIILFNIGFILATLFNDSHQTSHRNNELQIISKEMLIESNTLNN
jgi:hypothetical protein